MNREIIFRGKAVGNNNVWVYGDLEYRRWSGECYIHRYDSKGNYILPVKVIPATIGQYSGLKDKNGNEIYEGDILQTRANFKGVVMWHRNGNFYINDDKELKEKSCEKLGVMLEFAQFEVIGNIYDNNNIGTK